MSTALVTGITGQDGAYLARFLLEKGYRVVGTVRRSASAQWGRLEELGISSDVELVPCELLEASNLAAVLDKAMPDEVYNLAAQSFVGASFEQPLYTSHVNGLAVTHLLEAIRSRHPSARFYQASTSEMFGQAPHSPQNERTPFAPRSPYAVAKLYAHWMTVNYREAHGLHASSGILFNHESPLRGREFVSRKITLELARIRAGIASVLRLGNLDARRDWGHAQDYVEGMFSMVHQPLSGTYVLATGSSHSVRDFVGLAAQCAGFNLEWEGEGRDSRGIDRTSGRTVVTVDPAFYRPADVDALIGDASLAAEALGWRPKIAFQDLVYQMVEADLRRVAQTSSAV